MRVRVRQGIAGRVVSMCGESWSGMAGMERHGKARYGYAGSGKVRLCGIGSGMVWRGRVWQVSWGMFGRVQAL